MNLQNIECQLAQAQMSRYVAGDPLPDDTIQQLEKHLASCAECQAVATEKKVSLQAKLAQTARATEADEPSTEAGTSEVSPPDPEPMAAPEDDLPAPVRELVESVEPPEPPAPQEEPLDAEPSPPSAPQRGRALAALLQRVRALLRRPAPEAALKPAKLNLKTLALSGGLGLVLIIMSAFASDPTMLLGPKAKPVAKAPAQAEPAAQTKAEPQPKPPAPKPVPQPKKEPEAARPPAPAPLKSEEYAVARSDGIVGAGAHAEHVATRRRQPVHAAAPRRRNATRRAPAKAVRQPKAGTGTIRVYDEHGRPMGPATGG